MPFISGRSPEARHNSYLGAKSAQKRVSRQHREYLSLLAERGPLTDQQAADLMGVERTTINARRNELGQRVEKVGRTMGRHGTPNTRWGLTDAGREAVEAGA